ncbi:YbgA family protein [Nonomuraea sp. NPDC048826]|uniref:YbgA family protein n=1 Tax=Nonomuraea sp. NPDC048826 TaxID=3364347 RepID=UPI00371F8C09
MAEDQGCGRPRVAVSSCLLGEPVRHNGNHSRARYLTDELAPFVDWAPICPEMELGLGAPRESMRLERSPDGPRLMTRTSRRDLTPAMTELAAKRSAGLDADGYVFKAKSPSCGIHGIPLYAGDTAVTRQNRGLFADAVIEAHPLLPVEDEGRLNDAVLREAFTERIFAHARLRELLEGDWRPRDLVIFQSRHKMQLLAHSPVGYRETGRLVAEAGTRPRAELAEAYGTAFRTAMAAKASVGRNVNVLQHCLGMLGDELDPVRRADLAEVIDSYQARRVALSVPLALLRHHARGEAATYVHEQTFFSPYPDELGLRNHVV